VFDSGRKHSKLQVYWDTLCVLQFLEQDDMNTGAQWISWYVVTALEMDPLGRWIRRLARAVRFPRMRYDLGCFRAFQWHEVWLDKSEIYWCCIFEPRCCNLFWFSFCALTAASFRLDTDPNTRTVKTFQHEFDQLGWNARNEIQMSLRRLIFVDLRGLLRE
jgi:hypothetical protein